MDSEQAKRLFDDVQEAVTPAELFVNTDIMANFCFNAITRLDAMAAELQLEREERAKQANELREVYYLAWHDGLTGLPNRHHLGRHMHQLVHASEADDRLLIGVIDIDKFKLVNDTHGHLKGDQALCSLADNLQQIIRERDDSKDIVARIGGDEFMLVLDLTGSGLDGTDMEELEESLHRRINSNLHVEINPETYITFSASVGVAAFTIAELLSYELDTSIIKDQADQRMYERKRRRVAEEHAATDQGVLSPFSVHSRSA